MTDVFKAVRDFHKAFGLPIQDKPSLPDMNERDLRVSLLYDEWHEYSLSEDADDITNLARELADIIYIACGTALSYGIPLDCVFREVHRANMSKLIDGKAVYREDGKVLKPEGWKPPDIEKVMKNG